MANRKLTDQQIHEIRKMQTWKLEDIAAKYNIAATTAHGIRCGSAHRLKVPYDAEEEKIFKTRKKKSERELEELKKQTEKMNFKLDELKVLIFNLTSEIKGDQ